MTSVLTKNQKKVFSKKIGEYTYKVCVRYDDQCNNGHNEFAITCDIYKGRRLEAGGCMHDEVIKHFPELAHLVKWHLVSSEMPMHYYADTIYHAGNMDCYGRVAGEVSLYEKRIYFGDSPVGHCIPRGLDMDSEFFKPGMILEVFEVPYRKNPDSLSPKYTITGHQTKEWYKCPFDSYLEAKEWTKGLTGKWEIKKIPVRYSEGKAREFDKARKCAIWPDATDEELSVSPEELRRKLEERLPALMEEFRKDVEGLGFVY